MIPGGALVEFPSFFCNGSKDHYTMKNRTVSTKQTSLHRASAGFTLIELLVVVGIVALLCAIAMPGLSRVRQGAMETQSINQLRQIGIAMQAYANDNNQYFPLGYFYGLVEGRNVEKTYVSELLPYMGLPARFYEAKRNPFVSPMCQIPVRSGVSATFTPFTYSVHGLLCGDTSKGDNRLRRTAVPRPSEVILIGDGSQLASSYATSNFSNPIEFASANKTTNLDTPIPIGPDRDDASGRGYLRYRNRGKVAVIMVDGHSVMLKKGEVTYRNVIADQ